MVHNHIICLLSISLSQIEQLGLIHTGTWEYIIMNLAMGLGHSNKPGSKPNWQTVKFTFELGSLSE